MKKFFYPRLAFDGIRKNKRLYLPYILTQIGMIMMFYIVIFLRYGKSLDGSFGSQTVNVVLMLGGIVISIFACIFLFYTNSFLIRRRKKEFGLYNILGMDKGNISRLLFWESVITSAISLAGGLVFGIALSKLAELGLVKLIRSGDVSYSFYVSPRAVALTVGIFAVIFLLLFINSVRQIRGASAVTLLKSENVGEKPPKANPLLGIIGVLLLAGAYTIALVFKDPLAAMLSFFIAVIMVVIGTYLLMIFGSVLLCRSLQKRKNYYYKANHFVSVSSMAYRMKRNGAGLASICILATMVLVMVSSTSCLFFGTEDSIKMRYPRDITVSAVFPNINNLSDENLKLFSAKVDSAAEKRGANISNRFAYRMATTVGVVNDGVVDSKGTYVTIGAKETTATCIISVVPIKDYNAIMGKDETLASDEALIYAYRTNYEYDTITLGSGKTYKVKRVVDDFTVDGDSAMNITSSIFIFVPDFEQAISGFKGADGASNVVYKYFYGVDSGLDVEQERNVVNDVLDSVVSDAKKKGSGCSFEVDSRSANREDYFATFGSLFYLGIMLSIVFIFAAVLIIYYKQISEGYEDQARFEIMQKVGMTKREIRKSINSQLLTVFFLPLAGAGLHMVFASVIIRNILLSFNFNNTPLFVFTTFICFVVFSLFYTLVYRITSNAYYKIVSGAKERE